jgi:DNA-binding CsgD family transcriptional regulator
MTSRSSLDADDLQIVRLISEGLTRWAIAERLGLAETDVRTVIRRLCAAYDCNMRDLPDCVGLDDDDD